jgi:peptidoglycan/LPS O-acetylase OafA/YrhL
MPADLRDGSRLVALDGLRALAALEVVFAHSSYAIAKSKLEAFALFHSPVALLINASGAVHLFFVLSGYCLTASALRGTTPVDLAQFYLRRVARIQGRSSRSRRSHGWRHWLYPSSPDGITPWMRDLLGVRLSLRVPARARLSRSAGGLLPQGWTLQVEMIFSLLMPMMALLASRTHWAVLVAASLALLAVSEQFSMLRVALDFSMGIVVYLERDRLAAAFSRLPRGVTAILGLAGLLLVTLPMYTLLEARRPQLSSLVSSGGATLLLLDALYGPQLRRFLSWRPVAALGRVSYSIYLLHVTVLALLTPLLPPRESGSSVELPLPWASHSRPARWRLSAITPSSCPAFARATRPAASWRAGWRDLAPRGRPEAATLWHAGYAAIHLRSGTRWESRCDSSRVRSERRSPASI